MIAHLSYLFILFFEGFAIFSVEESGDANYFFFLVYNGKRQDVLDDETGLVHSFFLKGWTNKTCSQDESLLKLKPKSVCVLPDSWNNTALGDIEEWYRL